MIALARVSILRHTQKLVDRNRIRLTRGFGHSRDL